ncbi:MAG: SMP-30/gluconolactonase/LRE family protein [Rhodobacteraceae bacterium]|nr:SMP-30/gluconolactonase/LRE family protein [Paracoccaceae bacterium]
MEKQYENLLPAVTEPATPLFIPQAELGDSPVWPNQDQHLWWADTEGRKLLATTLEGKTGMWDTPELAGFVQLVAGGVLIVGLEWSVRALSSAPFQAPAKLALGGLARGRITLTSRKAEDNGDRLAIWALTPGSSMQ